MLTNEEIGNLKIGDVVYIDGIKKSVVSLKNEILCAVNKDGVGHYCFFEYGGLSLIKTSLISRILGYFGRGRKLDGL